MPQDMFEVMAISMAKYKLLGDEEFRKFKFAMHEAYKNDYKGDVLWLSQAEELIQDIQQLVTKIKAKDAFKYLTVASEFRQKLDENLEIPSATKKIFGGNFFTRSHPHLYRLNVSPLISFSASDCKLFLV